MTRRRLAGLLAAFVAGCAGPRPEGLEWADPGPGPKVIFDLDAQPLPDLPFPNDLATRPDPDSPTGKRLNLPLGAPTRMERKVRQHASRLEGFSTYGAITVRFDAPLDLDNLTRRQRANRDFDDDAVLLVNLEPRSPRYGQAVLLDFDQGNFPLTLPRLTAFWEGDPRAKVANLLFDTTDEDVNRNGRLDPGEDTDGDGVLDVPNVHPRGGDPLDRLLTFYEKATDTLLLKPVVPLEQEARYAVVLTKRLTGEDGHPVRSPFPYVHHLKQTEDLRGLPEVLRRYGLDLDQVAFAWTFTTQGPTRDLEALRRGLYGVGPFAHLAREFPVGLTLHKVYTGGGSPYLLPGAQVRSLAGVLGPIYIGPTQSGTDPEGIKALAQSFDNVAYVVMGEVEGPNLLADRNRHAGPGHPADEDEVWDLDRKTGHAVYGTHRIPFLCAVPRQDRGRGAPFPVALYAHGYGQSRVENLLFSGHMARYGIASCTIDAYGHGFAPAKDVLEVAKGIFGLLKIRPALEALWPGRARDLNNDGQPDPGADFFSGDVFHTRDMVRQTVLDLLVLTRALRALDGQRRSGQDLDGDGKPELLGDFDGDGRVDLGGPGVDYFAWGTSLGGIVSTIVNAVEPAIVAGAPSAGGGGLTFISGRTTTPGVPEAAMLRSMAPILIVRPGEKPGSTDLAAIVPSANKAVTRVLVPNVDVRAGDRVELTNLASGARYVTYAGEGGRARLHVAANALDPTELRVLLRIDPASPEPPTRVVDTPRLGERLEVRVFQGPTGALRATYDRFGAEVDLHGVRYASGSPLVALTPGLGLQRNTPDFRRMFVLAQMGVDPGDPVSYAPHVFADPLHTEDYDRARPGSNICFIVTAGDTSVPVATGIAAARAAGIVDYLSPDPRFGRPANQVLIDAHVTEALSWTRRFDGKQVVADPEDFSRGAHAPEAPRLGAPLRLTRATSTGLSAIRIPLLNPAGQHGFGVPHTGGAFDTDTFLIHMVGRFYQTRGRELRDDPCMATASCPWIPAPSVPLSP
ncbi:MAG: hypothetical protein IT371_22560 [Deltaproteobacteria bacterium]|nr:hypothetical protein [Deltaproteobacteria bacterium]